MQGFNSYLNYFPLGIKIVNPHTMHDAALIYCYLSFTFYFLRHAFNFIQVPLPVWTLLMRHTWHRCLLKSSGLTNCNFRTGCPLGPGFTLSKVYSIRPSLENNKDKRGLALDGQLKDEDTNLASSTMWGDFLRISQPVPCDAIDAWNRTRRRSHPRRTFRWRV